jgi:hypothetical protein
MASLFSPVDATSLASWFSSAGLEHASLHREAEIDLAAMQESRNMDIASLHSKEHQVKRRAFDSLIIVKVLHLR